MVHVAVPKESAPGERRVALTPEVVARLVKEGCAVRLEHGAGEGAFFTDEAFHLAGAEVEKGTNFTRGSRWCSRWGRCPWK